MTDDLKARLLKSRLVEKTIDVPGIGAVRVRGLSRGEVLLIGKAAANPIQLEQKILAAGMVEPKLTEKDVATWQRSASSGELELIVAEINELTGLNSGADKSGVPGTGDES